MRARYRTEQGAGPVPDGTGCGPGTGRNRARTEQGAGPVLDGTGYGTGSTGRNRARTEPGAGPVPDGTGCVRIMWILGQQTKMIQKKFKNILCLMYVVLVRILIKFSQYHTREINRGKYNSKIPILFS